MNPEYITNNITQQVQLEKLNMEDDSKNKKVQRNKSEIAATSSICENIVYPDVCKTPSSAGSVSIPYTNITKSSDTAKGTKKTKADGNPICTKKASFEKSSGDKPLTTDSIEWKEVEPLDQKLISMVGEHPVLAAVIILIILAILWVLM